MATLLANSDLVAKQQNFMNSVNGDHVAVKPDNLVTVSTKDHREPGIKEEVLWRPSRRVKVVSIGAGFSGLTMANKIQNKYKLDDAIDHTIYEKNPDIGGTWYENRYPGVMCDVPAHIYSILDIPSTEWRAFYATGPEIQDYLKKSCKEHDLDRDVVLNSRIISTTWQEDSGTWKLMIQQPQGVVEDWCDILIDGTGSLNNWSYPNIKGLRTFRGHLCHTAGWDATYDFTDKNVAVIGNGSSAIQIVPELQKVARKVTNIARSPTWISAPFGEELSKEAGTNPEYTDEEKEEFRNKPEVLRDYRKKIMHTFNHFYEALIEGSASNLEAKAKTKALMKQRLKNRPDLAAKLIPDWSLGCRRLSPGNGYLEALTEPNVDFIMSNVVEITPTGLRTADDLSLDFDAIVCATGFDVSFRPRWRQLGRKPKPLHEEWGTDAQGYFSICASGQPNYMKYNGPAGPVGHGSLSSAIDWEAEYMLKWILKVGKEDIKSFDPKQERQDQWNQWGDVLLKRTVWAGGCVSWYKNGKVDGRIAALYPGSMLHFKDMISELRPEDFDITYRNENMWTFLGNGFTQLEADHGDLAYYVER